MLRPKVASITGGSHHLGPCSPRKDARHFSMVGSIWLASVPVLGDEVRALRSLPSDPFGPQGLEQMTGNGREYPAAKRLQAIGEVWERPELDKGLTLSGIYRILPAKFSFGRRADLRGRTAGQSSSNNSSAPIESAPVEGVCSERAEVLAGESEGELRSP